MSKFVWCFVLDKRCTLEQTRSKLTFYFF